nr:hypothetical protein [Rhodoferax sp.]
MLAPQGALPPLRLLDGKRLRNPTVDLPAQAEVALDRVTHCLITHCQKGHFDHPDGVGHCPVTRAELICPAEKGRGRAGVCVYLQMGS